MTDFPLHNIEIRINSNFRPNAMFFHQNYYTDKLQTNYTDALIRSCGHCHMSMFGIVRNNDSFENSENLSQKSQTWQCKQLC